MKYMGSKRSMLLNGLGDAISQTLPGHQRFVDLFAGSAAVSWHVAHKFDIPVLAADLQQYSVVLAQSVLSRTSILPLNVFQRWKDRAEARVKNSDFFVAANSIQSRIGSANLAALSADAKQLSAQATSAITAAYAGYYYSPLQALWLDALRASLPAKQEESAVCLAALIWAASRCAAAPGHTAQPFKPNASAGKFLCEAWKRDVVTISAAAFDAIASLYSKRNGEFLKADANNLAPNLRETDLVFLDPPYSGVQYSRFYHVLETLASNSEIQVDGEGRYPPPHLRPQSDYSKQSASLSAFRDLLASLSRSGASAIVTFPAGKASNGLSGDVVREVAESYFKIKTAKVSGKFSTLGGNSKTRHARQISEELILTMVSRG